MISPGHVDVKQIPSSEKGYTLSWSDLSYTVKAGGSNKQILSNLYGILRPGTITAVLGASGSGKTSLLDVLAGRASASLVSGEVAINGSTDIPMKHASRYCTQEEALFCTLTVYETLMYAAHFHLSQNSLLAEKRRIVKEALVAFGLEKVSETIIGSPLRKGCSGGQVRRVSVASQVIGLNSGILFLDEPTSGLDSVAAEAVIQCVRSLALKENCTVIATIHQPSTQTFELFTHTLILGEGSTVYFGPREEAIPYFDMVGHPIPLRANPSDTYLQLTNTDFDVQGHGGKLRVAYLTAAFSNSPQTTEITQQIQNLKTNSQKYLEGTVTRPNSFFHQLKVLMSRQLINAARNPLGYLVRATMYILIAILMGTTWIRMDQHQSTVQSRLSSISFAVVFLSFMAVSGIHSFLEERHVFLRECANGLYSVEAYLLSGFLISIPFVFIFTIGFSSVAYFSMGLHSGVEKFCIFTGLLFATLMIAEAQAVFVSMAAPIFVAALAIISFINGLWMVVQGFFIQKEQLPAFWKYSFHQIDYQKYAYELFVTNEFSGSKFNCEIENGECSCLYKPEIVSENCTFGGEVVLRQFGYEDVSYTIWLGIMAAIFAFFKLCTYALLKITTKHFK